MKKQSQGCMFSGFPTRLGMVHGKDWDGREGEGREGFLLLIMLGWPRGNGGGGQYLIPVLCVHLLGGSFGDTGWLGSWAS